MFFFVFLSILFLNDELHIRLLSLCFSIFLFILFIFNFLSIDFLNFEPVFYIFEISNKFSLFFIIGVDLISAIFMLLTTFIFVIVVLIA
jgi:NADH:ubiquinone oxidoreductase subunit 4 (subunit M)